MAIMCAELEILHCCVMVRLQLKQAFSRNTKDDMHSPFYYQDALRMSIIKDIMKSMNFLKSMRARMKILKRLTECLDFGAIAINCILSLARNF